MSILDISSYLSEWLTRQTPTPTAHQLAERFGVKVSMSEGLPRRGPMTLRAEYTADPPHITIYSNTIRSWHDQLSMENPQLDLSQPDVIEICIFHEIIHHILHYPSYLYPQSYLDEIYQLTRTDQESIARMLTRDWLSLRYPQYNTLVEEILK